MIGIRIPAWVATVISTSDAVLVVVEEVEVEEVVEDVEEVVVTFVGLGVLVSMS